MPDYIETPERQVAMDSAVMESFKARELLTRHRQLLDEMLALCPIPFYYGSTKAKVAKLKSFPETYKRVMEKNSYAAALSRMYSDMDRRAVEAEKKLAEAKQKSEAEQAREALCMRAIQYCLNHGKTMADISNPDAALYIASQIHRDSLIAEATDGEGFQDFSGDDNCEGCAGWDGASHRCECGNRRVSWEYEGNFENGYIRGVAY